MAEENHLTDSFKMQLEKEYDWPAEYLFKFIVPKEQETELLKLLGNHKFSTKYSKNGNYLSVTSKVQVKSSDEIIQMYKAAYKIKGIISL